MLGKQVRHREVAPATINKLRLTYQEEFQNILHDDIRNLIDEPTYASSYMS